MKKNNKGRADPIDAYVGRKLRAARENMEMSQFQLARALDVSPQQVQKYERGINRMAAGKLFTAAQALECSLLYFFPRL